MSVTVTLSFATIAEMFSALGGAPLAAVVSATATAPDPKPETETKRGPGRPPKAASPSAAPAEPQASASTTADAAASPAASPTPEAAQPAPELPYPPLGARIAQAVATTNPRSQANRAALRELFNSLVHKDGEGKVIKTGQDIKAEDRPKLAAVLDKIDADAAAEADAAMA